MRFTFKRDENGHERVMVNDDVVWQCRADMRMNAGRGRNLDGEVTPELLGEAIERAGVSGFWASPFDNDRRFDRTIVGRMTGDEVIPIRVAEVTVEVPSC